MKLKCSLLIPIIIVIVAMGGSFTGGYVIGKRKTTTVIQNISNTSQAISQSISVSGIIELTSRGNNAIITLDIDGITNIKASSVSNGITNAEDFQIKIR